MRAPGGGRSCAGGGSAASRAAPRSQYRNYTVAALASGQIQYVQCGVYGAPENPVAIYAASGQTVYNGIGEALATSSTPYFAIGILMLQGAANGSVYILNRGDLSS